MTVRCLPKGADGLVREHRSVSGKSVLNVTDAPVEASNSTLSFFMEDWTGGQGKKAQR